MSNGNSGPVRHSLSRGLLAAVAVSLMTLWSTMAMATITQGDFSVFGNFSSRWSGRWGEGSSPGGTATTFPIKGESSGGIAPSRTGGSFDFNHWDLVQARQVADIRPDYHIVKNYNFLGRLDTLFLKDADVFAVYRPWYDAFADLKHTGIAQTSRDWTSYTNRSKIQQFVRDDLREYYAQLNFNDNFSMRVGKQQVIWSEADALSGTEVTNPNDLRYHWTHFEAPEDIRQNLRMAKFNYILPDFLKTANNEFEFFVIPGDWENSANIVNTTDARSPYILQLPIDARLLGFNLSGQPYRNVTLADQDPTPLIFAPFSGLGPIFLEQKVTTVQKNLTNSLDNSEFGARYSTLLPIGNGLQTSLIYLYEARSPKLVFCQNCPAPKGFIKASEVPGIDSTAPPATFFSFPSFALPPGAAPLIYGPPKDPRVPVLASVNVFLRNEIVREHWFGLTGTYYDKDLTDIVYRYDVLYAPKVGVNVYNGGIFLPHKAITYNQNEVGGRWSEETRWVVAGDRPTYIPWISKQHTFITFQNTTTWYPDRPNNAVEASPFCVGKLREISNLSFIAFTNWLINGQLTTLNIMAWDWDDNVGAYTSTNSYRYSRNILFAINAIWYLGRSGRYTDPFFFSRDQRINEAEFRFTYEI